LPQKLDKIVPTRYSSGLMARIRGNKVKLGFVDGKGAPLEMTPEMRSTHLYVGGSTGTGKSKMFESLIRQEIAQFQERGVGTRFR